jgi:hypothetical protein
MLFVLEGRRSAKSKPEEKILDRIPVVDESEEQMATFCDSTNREPDCV